MTRPLRILLVAGEASGDLHGAALVRALERRVPDVEVSGIGGEHLRGAGMKVLVDAGSVATMGFTETFGMIGRLYRAYRLLVRFLDEQRPDLVVLIDYPEFNLLLARQAKRRAIPVFYFIAPQVWAWRRWRIEKIRRRVDRLGVVFPFEPSLYNNGRRLAEFIGHPLLDVVRADRPRAETLERCGLRGDRPTVALLPGSRRKELRALVRPMCEAAEILAGGGWQAVLALAPGLTAADVCAALDGREPRFPVVGGDTYNLVAASDAAIVASGTATLETALLGCPMVIVYRLSALSHWLARRLVQVDWIGMPNILLGRTVFPELIQKEATPEAMAEGVRGLAARREELHATLVALRARLGEPGAAGRAADLALELVR
jgi:lipid-A-disaccharide synthase